MAGALDIEELSKARSRGVLSGRQDAMSAKVQSLHDQLKALRAQLDQAEGEKIQIKVTEALRGEPSRSPSPPPGRQVYARRNMATIAETWGPIATRSRAVPTSSAKAVRARATSAS